MYDLSGLEIFEILNSFDKYIREGKLELAAESIKIQEIVHQIGNEFVPSSTFLRNQANLALSLRKYGEVVETLKGKIDSLPMFDFDKILLLPLLITGHMFEGDEIKVLESVACLLDVLSYYFGEEMWVHTTIYSMLG